MKIKKIILIPILVILTIIISSFLIMLYNLSPVSTKDTKTITFEVKEGWSKYNTVEHLKSEGLIRSAFFGKLLIKLTNRELFAGTYKLSKDMSTNEILEKISNQSNIENESITLTFIEGKRLSNYIKTISENFPYTIDEINELLNDKEFLDSLIEKYWFITDSIYNESIYNPLEGYFYPDTYEFKKNSTLEEIVYRFLDNLDNKLSDYKEDIELGTYSVHEYLTLASIIELEGGLSEDRKDIAGVFYNRLNSGMKLGSDVTTYYAVNKDFSAYLTKSDLNSCNGYNTRGDCVKGLPVGPICNMSLSSIAASIEPNKNDYYYFVADKNKKTYFSKNYSEHEETIATLKSEGKWYEY